MWLKTSIDPSTRTKILQDDLWPAFITTVDCAGSYEKKAIVVVNLMQVMKD
jgi:hypothetical protein